MNHNGLVQISVNAHKNRMTAGLWATMKTCECQYPPEYKQLIARVDEFWRIVDSAKICGPCFAGTLTPAKVKRLTGKKVWRWAGWRQEWRRGVDGKGRWKGKSTGCCSQCPSLGHSKCEAKPLGCAVWTCEALEAWVEKRLGVEWHTLIRGERWWSMMPAAGAYLDGFKAMLEEFQNPPVAYVQLYGGKLQPRDTMQDRVKHALKYWDRLIRLARKAVA